MPNPPDAPINIESLLKRFRGKVAVVEQVLGEFEEQAVGDLRALVNSVNARDAETTASVAHALKGAAGLVSAQALHQAVAELEQMARLGNLEVADECLTRAKDAGDAVLTYISTVRSRISEPGWNTTVVEAEHADSDR